VSDETQVDLTGALRVGQTVAGTRLIVNNISFDIPNLYEIWSRPLAEVYP
jgi:hypothetical protein